MRKKISKQKMRWFLSGHFHVITLDTIDRPSKRIVSHYCVKSRTHCFTSPDGRWKFYTPEEARAQIPYIKESLRKEIQTVKEPRKERG